MSGHAAQVLHTREMNAFHLFQLYTLDKIKLGYGMTYLSSYQGFLCCCENTGPWASTGFNILKLYLLYLLSNLSVSVNFLNAT